MTNLTTRHQKILLTLLRYERLQSSKIQELITLAGEDISLVTVKRDLTILSKNMYVQIHGVGRSTFYSITALGRLYTDINAEEYCAIEPDRRFGLKNYNYDLLSSITSILFTNSELSAMNNATDEYKKRVTNLSPILQQKELERFIIELAWKSSRIEGNTYTLLDTEKLILEKKEAAGHDKKEAIMILNHKVAFSFILKHVEEFKSLTKTNLEQLHTLLVTGMGVDFGLRKKPVGVTGSVYRPLDNIYQIAEGVEDLTRTIERIDSPYAKAMIALLAINYLQPFEDGNKRTSRLMANAILLAYGCAPLSYRSIEEVEYRNAMLVFYEVNSLIPFKRIFLAQYDFAARTYLVR